MHNPRTQTLRFAMRSSVIAGLALTGCKPAQPQGADAASGASGASAATSAATAAAPRWQVTNSGIHRGTVVIDFGMQRADVEAAMAAAGQPTPEKFALSECDSGPAESNRYGAMVLNFQDGQFAGWFLQQRQGEDGKPISDPTVDLYRTADGYGIGTRRNQIVPATLTELPVSSLDNEFRLGPEDDGIGGFFSGPKPEDTIIGLYSGVTCFAR